MKFPLTGEQLQRLCDEVRGGVTVAEMEEFKETAPAELMRLHTNQMGILLEKDPIVYMACITQAHNIYAIWLMSFMLGYKAGKMQAEAEQLDNLYAKGQSAGT